MGRIAILGGTGPEGMGLGLRFAMAGEEVVLGSRQAGRAAEAAAKAGARLGTIGCTTPVRGVDNETALRGADIVVVATPFAGVRELLPPLADALAGAVVIDVVNPLIRAGKQLTVEPVPEGSAAEAIQGILARSYVVSAFKNESAEKLSAIEGEEEGDVIVCSDHREARERVLELVRCVPRYRPVDAGALINARSLEAITALLLNLNRRHHAITSIQILGLGAGAAAAGAPASRP